MLLIEMYESDIIFSVGWADRKTFGGEVQDEQKKGKVRGRLKS